MALVLVEQQGFILLLTLNRADKKNAFDKQFLAELQDAVQHAVQDESVRVIVLKAAGAHFSAGAQLQWMQHTLQLSIEENVADAMVLSEVMSTIYHSPKPIIAMVHGAAIGGGAGLVAASDIAIAASTARFCFSETKLGLIPAVISPYVVKAIGERVAAELFMSAQMFNAERALALNLVHYCVPEAELLNYTLSYAESMAHCAPIAVRDAKLLVRTVADKPIDPALQLYTAELIAKKRISAEAQRGMTAFLNKTPPVWD